MVLFAQTCDKQFRETDRASINSLALKLRQALALKSDHIEDPFPYTSRAIPTERSDVSTGGLSRQVPDVSHRASKHFLYMAKSAEGISRSHYRTEYAREEVGLHGENSLDCKKNDS